MSDTLRLYEPSDSGKIPDGPLTVGQVVDSYLTHGLHGSAVAMKETERVLRIFCETFGPQLPDKIKPLAFLEWLKAQPGLKSDHTIHRWVKTVKAALNWAVKWSVLERNPLAAVTWPHGPSGRSMKLGELLPMLRGTTPVFRRALIFLRCCGCRPCELALLEWSMFDEATGQFRLDKHKTMHKTRKPRVIVMPDVLLKLLAWIRRHGAHERYVLLNAYGRPWTPEAMQKRVRRLRQRLNLPDDCRLYGTRHAQISGGLVGGNDLKTASLLAGHSSVAVTSAVYIHLEDEAGHLREGANRAARLIAKKHERPPKAP